MNDKELNKKLAEWARCQMEYDRVFEKPFTESLDACFKWLVPKLTKEYIELEIHLDYLVKSNTWNLALLDGFYNPDEPKYLISVANSKDPALAMCLAIEKLIDSEAIIEKSKELNDQ